MSKSKRILHLQSGGGLSGGIAGYIETLVGCDTLSHYEFSVTVADGESSSTDLTKRYGRSKIVEVPSSYGPLSFVSAVYKLYCLARRHKIDLIHSHALRFGLVCAVLNFVTGQRFIHTNHGLRFTQKRGGFQVKIFKIFEKFVVSRSDAAICIRQTDLKILKLLLPKSVQKLHLIQTKIDTKEKVSQLTQKFAHRGGERHLIIGVGSLIPVKRVDRFIDWLCALKALGVNFEAVWIGDGYLKAELSDAAAKKNVEIEWLGQISPERVASELENASIMLLTSEFEVLSLAALEAMASRTPVVTTNFLGAEDFVQHDFSGLILDEAITSAAAAEAIRAVLQDSEKLDELKAGAFSKFRDEFFGSEQMGIQYHKLYSKII